MIFHGLFKTRAQKLTAVLIVGMVCGTLFVAPIVSNGLNTALLNISSLSLNNMILDLIRGDFNKFKNDFITFSLTTQAQLNTHNLRLDTLETLLNTHESRLNTLETQLSVLIALVNAHGARLDTHESLLNTLISSVNAFEIRLVTVEVQLDALVALLNTHGQRLNTLETQVNTLIVLVNVFESRLNTLEVQLDALISSVSDHELRLDTLEVQVSVLVALLNTHGQRLDTLESQVGALISLVSTHESRLDVLEAQFDTLIALLNTYGQRLDTLESQVSTLISLVNELETWRISIEPIIIPTSDFIIISQANQYVVKYGFNSTIYYQSSSFGSAMGAIPSGNYYITLRVKSVNGTLTVKNGWKIDGGGAILKYQPLLYLSGLANVKITNFVLDEHGINSQNKGLYIGNCENITLENVKIINVDADTGYINKIASSKNIILEKCEYESLPSAALNNVRIYIDHVSNLKISDCKFIFRFLRIVINYCNNVQILDNDFTHVNPSDYLVSIFSIYYSNNMQIIENRFNGNVANSCAIDFHDGIGTVIMENAFINLDRAIVIFSLPDNQPSKVICIIKDNTYTNVTTRIQDYALWSTFSVKPNVDIDSGLTGDVPSPPTLATTCWYNNKGNPVEVSIQAKSGIFTDIYVSGQKRVCVYNWVMIPIVLYEGDCIKYGQNAPNLVNWRYV